MTDNPSATVSDDLATVQRTVLIRADRHRVWEAITTPELITEWFAETAQLDRLEVGASGTLGWDEHGEFALEIREVDEPSVFAFAWGLEPDQPLDPDTELLVRFTLEETADGTRLTVVETGWTWTDDDERRAEAQETVAGWNEELDQLVALLERQDSV